MIYKGYNVRWEPRPRVTKPIVDPLFGGLDSQPDDWDFLQTVVNRYLSFDAEMNSKYENPLCRYLISRKAHDAVRARLKVGNYESESFEFWVLLLRYLEWEENEQLLSNFPIDYAHRFLTEVAPDRDYNQKKDEVKSISKVPGLDIPYDILLKLVTSTPE